MTTAFAELPGIVDPDALKSFLAVLFAVAHPPTNEKTWSLAKREGEDVSPSLAYTNTQASEPTSFSINWGENGVASACKTRSGWWEKRSKVIEMQQDEGSTWSFLAG